ncbi:beta-lactamase family protein [Gimesia chilikensis]|uniref:serine hydrolase domain-containing protein n=1 Tax=Gimesia chilikensis TaxID=2605989 RepID=UPI0011EDE84F|nr:serine hydrolase domain-containing protein [Gimesia chilikensis]KAA0133641.1 beta-lactamase family protein [Gimesia chilikensis]
MSRIHPARWQTVEQLVDQYCESGQVPAIALQVITGETTCHYRQGRQSVKDVYGTLRDDAIFLVASITKPIVVLGVLKLLEQGELLLNDRVKQYIPEFGCAGKHGITIRHLMTHTSGLPDMLPNNRELRSAQAPLSEFVSQICELTPDEPPGRIVQYQSTGIAILGELIQRLTGKSAPQYLQDELFQPLEMHDTSLGVPPAWSEGDAARLERIVEIHVPPELNVEPHWDWNSSYWRGFGAPWGGLFTTPADLGKLVDMLQQQGLALDQRLFSGQTIHQATRDQLPEIPGLSETARQGKGWGLGWQIVTRAKSDYYGDLLSDQAYGHGGATGTVLWIDPQLDAAAIILTTEPQEPHGRYLARLSNAIVAAIEV